jgi:PAS domain S-box-containing protein
MTLAQLDSRTLQQVLKTAPFGLAGVGLDHRVELWTGAASAILGWSEQDIVGKPLPFEFPAREGVDLQVSCRNRTGHSVELLVHSSPWIDVTGARRGTVLTLIDRTAQLSAERSVRELTEQGEQARTRAREENRFRELLEAAPDAIIEIDREGKIVLLNKVTEHMFGYTREQLLGQPVEVLIPEEFHKAHANHRARYWGHPSTRPMGTGLQLEGRRKNGTLLPVEISLSPVKFEEGFRVSAIIRDVTERRLAEEQLRAVQARYTQELSAKNQELEARNQEVERANRLKSEFLSGMSHELRTPLHTIIGFSELLAEEMQGPLNEKQKRFVNHIHRDAQHLLALINDVLDLSKIESGRLELQKAGFALDEAIEESVSSVQARADTKAIRISIAGRTSVNVTADRLRVKQILYNLLSNAVKFTGHGGSVSVEVQVVPLAVEVSVRDTGIGIHAAQHEAVFDKFYQVGLRQAGGEEGTGLGLAITRRLVEEHGGTIRLESEPGKGSCFTFSLPMPVSK